MATIQVEVKELLPMFTDNLGCCPANAYPSVNITTPDYLVLYLAVVLGCCLIKLGIEFLDYNSD